MLFWFISRLLPVIFSINLKKEPFKLISNIGLIGFFLAIPTLVPLFVKVTSKSINSTAVKQVICNTKITEYTMMISLIIGFCITMFLTKKRIKRNNWWIYALALPYIVAFSIVNNKYQSFLKFTKLPYFSNSNVARMISESRSPNIMLINELWYLLITMEIIACAIMLGGLISASLRQKETLKKPSAKIGKAI